AQKLAVVVAQAVERGELVVELKAEARDLLSVGFSVAAAFGEVQDAARARIGPGRAGQNGSAMFGDVVDDDAFAQGAVAVAEDLEIERAHDGQQKDCRGDERV